MQLSQTASEIPQHVLDYLGRHMTLTLATASATGVPRATTLTYVNDGPVLYVWTRAESAVALNVERNPLVSFAIDDYSEDWSTTQGVQGQGECRPVLDGGGVARAIGLFAEKFESASAGGNTSSVSFLRIVPTELVFIDNSSGSTDAGAFGVEFHRDLAYSMYRDLPRRDSLTMSTQLTTASFEPGEVIVRQGTPATKFFIVLEGEVEVTHDGGGSPEVIDRLGAGQFFGEMAVLRDVPRSTTVKALRATTLLAMERETFTDLVADSLGTAPGFERTIQERLST